MRTIEALGNGCIIFTNNEKIKNESFYNPDYVYVYKSENELKDIIKTVNFTINADYGNTSKYVISTWLENIL